MPNAKILDLGVRSYREVWEIQHAVHERVRSGAQPETWIVVEHPPVITLGRNANAGNVLLTRELLAQRGIDVVNVERGGDVTYHGPGQLVIYPIRKLERFREVVPLVRSIEDAVIDACATFGVAAEPWNEHAGVWVGRNQICAVGLAIQKMVSLHGLALNVSTALDYDRLITPCGLPGRGVTSLSAETGRRVGMDEAKTALLESLSRRFAVQFESASLERAS